MISVKDSNLYKEVIQELNYPFGDVYIFKGFVVSEIHHGQTVTWENHGSIIADDVSAILNTKGENLVYISNRINSYSVVASDWMKFYKYGYSLSIYCIVSKNKAAGLNSMIEKLFFKKKIRHFKSLYAAVNFVKQGLFEIT